MYMDTHPDPRPALLPLVGQTRKFLARVERRGKYNTILLKDIRDRKTRVVLADHLWIWDGRILFFSLSKSIEFTAQVTTYSYNGSTRACLTNLHNVKIKRTRP
jgi:hypothetical protein